MQNIRLNQYILKMTVDYIRSVVEQSSTLWHSSQTKGEKNAIINTSKKQVEINTGFRNGRMNLGRLYLDILIVLQLLS